MDKDDDTMKVAHSWQYDTAKML